MKRKTWLLILANLLFLCAPPLLCSAAIVIADASQNFNGTCPGLMDIPPYPCTLSDYVWRLTASPFALAGHLLILVVWLTVAVTVSLVGWIAYKAASRFQATSN